MKKGYWVVAYKSIGDEMMMGRYGALSKVSLDG
jgi:hypothetical protein